MRWTHTSVFFDLRCGTLEFRLHAQSRGVTGHFMASDRKTYHNTASLVVDEKFQTDQIKQLLHHAMGMGNYTLRDESDVRLAIIGLPGVCAF